MEWCPHCGEPIDGAASSCPHCGSDDETGWNPESDYYSLELPEDDLHDESFEPSRARAVSWPWPGTVLVALAVGGFFWAGFAAYGWAVLAPIAFLGLCVGAWSVNARRRPV